MVIAAQTIEPVKHRLELKEIGNLFVIDDAFNSNPIGANNAVEMLAQFQDRKRIIITPGMVELGEIERQENYKFGQKIGKAHLDLILLVGKKRSIPILEGIKNSQRHIDNVEVVDTLFKANDLMKNYASSGDIILYENDLPDVYNE
jgi:UDP-N-acetylmuramoyl-tripeptide--D-alanyl-D-alanine ligase